MNAKIHKKYVLKFQDIHACTYRNTFILNDALTFGTPCM